MDVLSFAEVLDEVFVAAEVGHDAEFYLGVVRGEEDAARLGDEGFADFASVVAAHGDVLQVRVARGQAPRGRDGLVE